LSVACARAAVPRAGNFLQQPVHDEGIARIDGARCLAGQRRLAFHQHLARLVGDPGDEEGVDAVAAVGEHRIGRGHLHRRDRASPQRHGQVGRVLLGLEAKAGDPLLRVLGAHGLQDADGHHVLGLGQRSVQRHRAFELAVVVLGLPGLAAGDAGIEEQRRVVDHGGRREALFQRR
jgi:hypothetical protein